MPPAAGSLEPDDGLGGGVEVPGGEPRPPTAHLDEAGTLAAEFRRGRHATWVRCCLVQANEKATDKA